MLYCLLCGRQIGYGGGVVYTRAPSVPKQFKARIDKAFAKAGVDPSLIKETDNTCKYVMDPRLGMV